MFFPRLRRRAKWVFLALALAFAIGFVGFGVGAGGSGIGDYLADLVNREGQAGGSSLEEARERVAQNPNDAQAQRELANALQAEGRTGEAIAALESYRRLRPKDADGLQQLASLYDVQASEARERAAAVQSEAQATLFAQELAPPSNPLGETIAGDPLTQALRQTASDRASEAIEVMQTAYAKEASVLEQLAAIRPDDPNVFLQLAQAAQFSNDARTAIKAYKRFLTLAPEDANAPLVREQIRLLRTSAGTG